ncbi:unnamed protein product [Allacma fusca]|uniref:Serine carboxypeptidase CPVL n=1 Tax=Allacma fusca TaxID=39272 RepID=A0A8J2K5Q7_9HEXA|nr:unnamed protein product [Allacma fusca]
MGKGFSFADSKEALANNLDEEATQIFAALKQFFTLFNEFQSRDLFLAGANYAAASMPYIAKHVEEENATSDVRINLKGFIIGSPFLDLKQEVDRAQTLLNFGLIDEEQKSLFDREMSKARNLIQEGSIDEGTKISWSTITGPDSLLAKTAGFTDCRSALMANFVADESPFEGFLDTKQAHNYLHVGLHKFIDIDLDVTDRFTKEFISSHEVLFEEMLNKGYKVLVYSGQFDILVTEVSVMNVIQRLKWKGAKDFAKARRNIWRVK